MLLLEQERSTNHKHSRGHIFYIGGSKAIFQNKCSLLRVAQRIQDIYAPRHPPWEASILEYRTFLEALSTIQAVPIKNARTGSHVAPLSRCNQNG